ncbi:hypothetical protein JIQ42_06843 [Leishmania sp. Namibia]|uniref:hypothetical protein n=1 Tax=Leishmania sp. Namibia TaxID=2802991 RepID=UPI001B610B11|nr:hypothetical protein JIQ42_06843 [Leishmania sp. Namibia]
MGDDVSQTLPFASLPPPQPLSAFAITERAKSVRANLAHASTTGAGDHVSAASTWLRRQKLKRSSPPPPLSSLALSAAKVNLRTPATRVAPVPFYPRVHSGVALAAPRRLAASSKPVAPPETVGDGADAAAAEVSFHEPSAVSPAPFSPRDGQKTDTPLLFRRDTSSGGDDFLPPRTPLGGGEHCDRPRPTADAPALLWWKRILVDAAYRQRLMQLSTEGYHEELRLVRETPELLSSDEGMEVCKVRRERRWMEDALEKAELRPPKSDVVGRHEAHGAACGIAALSSPFAPYHIRVKERAAQQRPVTSPMMEEVDEVVVMSQHVVFRVGSGKIASHFSANHPRSIIDASALESVHRVALGAMPPVQHVREQQQLEHAVKQHLSSLRRFSRKTPYELKEILARDIAAGRADLPMQTAITDAVMNEDYRSLPGAGATDTTWQRISQDMYVFPSVQHSKRDGDARQRHHDHLFPVPSAPIIWQLPLRKPQMPATPLWQRSRLPAGMWAVEAALADVTRAEALLHASAVRDPLAVVKRTAPITDMAEAPKRHEGPRSATGAVGSVTAAAADSEQHHDIIRVRRQEAAVACVDGTENLYGLQYVWCAPLPPGGFIRVSPDPRFAMWPESDEESDEGVRGGTEKYGTSRGCRLHARDGCGITGGECHSIVSVLAGASQHRDHQGQMRRLARRVNHRTHKLRWLHSIGRHRVHYNDLALSDSDGSSAGYTSPATSAVRNSDVATKAKVSGKAMYPATLHGTARRPQWRRREGREGPSRAARPVYDGALNINIYAEVAQNRSRSVAATNKHNTVGASLLPEACQHQHGKASDAATLTRRFLGCYRQSRLLIHFKLYCRALYEEERVRCGGPGTRVIGRAGGKAPEYTPSTEGPLAGVPAIPHPVLKLQERTPSLQKPYARRVPVASTMSGCRCWEGLYPGPCVDLAAPAHQAWRQLRQSSLVRQALRDIFDELPHDREGLLDKRSFVLFVLQLLELFFPTRLPAALHIAIAEEEWVYRGTTEHVGPQTFHEKFFVFPFIFYRDIAAVTEAQLVEFWTLVRVCFDAQKRAYGEAAATGRSDHALQTPHLSLLTPLTHFTAEQLDTLLSCPPPAFDAAVYDRHCLLRQAFRDAPKVRAAPRDRQYVVARSVVEKQQQSGLCPGNGKKTLGKTKAKILASVKAYRERLGSADVERRTDIQAAAQREWDLRQRRLQEQEHEALLEQSDYYHARIGRVQSRAATVISGVESTCSTWELHRTGVYAAPKEDENADAQPRMEEDVEELLEYLDDVPLDVFDGQVSLRERYLLHINLQRERRHNILPSLQSRPEPACLIAAADGGHSAALASVSLVARTTPCTRNVLEDEARRHVSAMTSGLRTMPRRAAVSTEAKFLLDGTIDVSFGASATPSTTSGAAAIHAMQEEPRTVSMVRRRSRAQRRRARRVLGTSNQANNSEGGGTHFVSPFASFSVPAPRAPSPHSSTIRDIHDKYPPKNYRGAGVSGLCRGKDEYAGLATTVSSASQSGVHSKSLYRKSSAALPRPLARPATLVEAGAPSSIRRCASPLPQHTEPLMSGVASSASALARRGVSPAISVRPGEDIMVASPECVSRVSQRGSTVVQGVGLAPPHPQSASQHYAQRLRAQQRRQQQYKQQFINTASTTAGIAGHY